MSIHVSEPGRPVPTRLPDSVRGRRVGQVGESPEIQRSAASSGEATDAAFLNAQQVTARRAFAEYGEASESEPEAQRPYLPVSKLCTGTVYYLSASATMDEAIRAMEEHGVHHMVIIAQEVVAGLIELRWLLGWLNTNQTDPRSQSFSQVELPSFLTATPETDAHQLARLMLAHQLNAALVLDRDGSTVGIVTSTDYLRLYADISRQAGAV
ncbi:CBS domain-containing protein [Marinobacter salicampi]|uniref:CBS domain-containing protein n=1 Tax=Marinobacter salicampi TaxID=435907 RepID=UPI00140D51AC|nr:CBS domain-containing protein [Marinobacter salicampi]